jgi:hypothetical protein
MFLAMMEKDVLSTIVVDLIRKLALEIQLIVLHFRMIVTQRLVTKRAAVVILFLWQMVLHAPVIYFAPLIDNVKVEFALLVNPEIALLTILNVPLELAMKHFNNALPLLFLITLNVSLTITSVMVMNIVLRVSVN